MTFDNKDGLPAHRSTDVFDPDQDLRGGGLALSQGSLVQGDQVPLPDGRRGLHGRDVARAGVELQTLTSQRHGARGHQDDLELVVGARLVFHEARDDGVVLELSLADF